MQSKQIIYTSSPNIPQQQTPGSAGFDVAADTRYTIPSKGTAIIGTGIKLEAQSAIWYMLAIRSSLAKEGLSLLNGVGIIDSDYTDEIKLMVHNRTDYTITIELGERVGQIIPMQLANVSFKSRASKTTKTKTKPRTGGFGSTGK